MPMMPGSASGLRMAACRSAPETAMAALYEIFYEYDEDAEEEDAEEDAEDADAEVET